MFSGVFARGGAAAEVSGGAWLQAMLDVEAALARACARAGLAPRAAADAITAAARAEDFDVAALGAAAASDGNPVIPLVRELRARVPEDAAAFVHQGATSQDVLDTAAMLVARRALAPLLEDAAAAAEAAAELAEHHRATLMVGRTLLQQATPITFALKAAGWLVALDEARGHVDAVAVGAPAVQLGGAVGTLAVLGRHGPEVVAALAEELDLAEPTVPWHTARVRPAAIAGALAVQAGVLGKVARDVVLLSQNEVGEVREGGPGGGSSTMPHKRNPVAAVSVLACAERVPGLVATLHAAMVQEHERAAGAWQAEWETLSDLLRLVGAAASWARAMLEGLEVDAERMRANLAAAGDTVMAESVVTALAPHLGKAPAQELLRDAAARAREDGRALRDVLAELPDVLEALGDAGLDAALDPSAYLGAAAAFVDRALAAHRA